MTKISKQTHPDISEEKRKEELAKIGYDLRKSQEVEKLEVFKKIKKS